MAEDDDDSFGDFTFASFPPNILIHAPQSTIEDDDDDEWGDFVDFSRGSDPSNEPSQTKPFHPLGVFSNNGSQHPVQSTPLSEPATSQTDSSKTAQWNPQFQSGKPSLHASEHGNLSSNLGISELGLRNDFGTVHNSDWNLTASGSKSQAVESSSTEWNTDLNNLLSDQTALSSNTSVDVTNLNERSEDSLIGSTTGGLSSDITASRLSFSGWGFDFGEFGSTSKTSNSTFSGFNSNSDALVFGCANSLLFTSLIFTSATCLLKAGSEAQEIHETKAFGNGSNRLLFPMSNGSEEADSHGHYTGDMKAYSVGTDNGSNGYLNSDLRGHDTNNIMAYSYGNVSNHSIDIFSMSNGTDLEVLDTGDMKAFSSAFSNGSVITNESVKAKPEARDTNDLNTNLLGHSGSDNHSIDLFAIANGISGIIHENEVENNKPSTSAQNSFIPDSYWTSEKSVSNGIADPIPVIEGVETDEDFGEFTGALSDSGSKQEGELKDTDLSHELEVAKSGNKHQVNVIGSNHKGALPLSIFGDEELETDASSTVEDGFICHLTSFPKIEKKQEPVISINDLISSLYSQAEHTSSISSLQNLSDVVEPPDSGARSNLVNGEDAFGDESWEYKGGIPLGTENKTSIFHHGDSLPSSLSIRKLDNYVDFYSELKKELSLYSKYHLGNPQDADKELDLEGYTCEEDDLEGHPSWETCFHEFIEVLRKPKFQVLESEYNLSRRLSQMENDFNSAVELINHASIMLRLLTFASAKEQLIYVSVWYKIFSVCTQELKHGTWLWKQISDNDAQSYVFSNTRGRQYVLGLVEIYKVAVVLGASVKLYQPWTWLNSVDFTGIYSLLNECHALWSRLGLEQAILNTSDPASTGTIRLSLDNIKSIHDLDAFALQNHIFSQKEVICRLSLLTSEAVNGMKLVIWNGEQYFVTFANLWANLISNDPPELPHLSFGW
nr:probable serine/threonine-protein kinase DDB_G0282963 isoform X1 [Ipomoea batatas]